jgi:hypothetical protein
MSMAGGRWLFLEVFFINFDISTWQTVINSSIADFSEGLMFFSLLSPSLTAVMADSKSNSWFLIPLSLP